MAVLRGEFADVQEAQALVAEARQWLADRSIDQWQDPVPDKVIEADVHHGRLLGLMRAQVSAASGRRSPHPTPDALGHVVELCARPFTPVGVDADAVACEPRAAQRIRESLGDVEH